MPDANNAPAVLVTGAAGGLGRALVTAFAAQGWRVFAGVHRTPLPDCGERVQPVPLDVTQRESVAGAFQSVLEQAGRLDALVNNAGLAEDRLLPKLDDDAWQRVLDVNLRGAFLCAQAALRPMLRQRDGHILNVASFSARAGQAGQANYAAAKAGLIGLTQSLAREAGSRNVRVNAVLPGVLRTGMTAGLGEERLAEFAAANALGRLNDLDEVARFVVFLAGTRNVSGQVFQLDSRVARWT
jgi:3-oxoacyl-[acyl-carrier protein] reductase